MEFKNLIPPGEGDKIEMADGKLKVPDNPIICLISIYHICSTATLRKWYPYTANNINLANLGGDLTR